MTYPLSARMLATTIKSGMVRSLYRLFAPLLFVVLLSACGNTEAPAKEEGSASSISGFNYTFEGIQEFYVNGEWGGNLGIGAGYDKVCCVSLPEKWTPGLTATVDWRRSDCGDAKITTSNKRCPAGTGGHGWQEKTLKATVPIEPYDRPNSVQVMFLPGDEIKIYVSHMSPDHPDHPSKLGRPRPLDHPEWKPYQP